jgi:ribosomal protein S18 acetylase RimI-like enzyme
MSEGIRVVEALTLHDAEARAKLWAIYEDAFQRLNERTPIHHGAWSRGSFDEMLLDADFTKFLVYVADELVGACLITATLEKVPWINADFYRRRFPDVAEAGKLFFLPAVVIDPVHQDLRRIGAKLLHEAVTSLGDDGVLAVDYSETLRHSLPAFVKRSLRRDFQSEVLDRMVYQVFYYRRPG